jgi:hypothetical protein
MALDFQSECLPAVPHRIEYTKGFIFVDHTTEEPKHSTSISALVDIKHHKGPLFVWGSPLAILNAIMDTPTSHSNIVYNGTLVPKAIKDICVIPNETPKLFCTLDATRSKNICTAIGFVAAVYHKQRTTSIWFVYCVAIY